MKIRSAAVDIQRSGDIVESSFGISVEDSAHILNILRDKLYSNKILAVIREYSTNAYDAHVEAGIADRPIKITLPNRLEPTFSVRDYGYGLTENDVRNIYAMYGASTKRSSNAFTGQLGLGCKSGFSYADRFSITTWKNKEKKEYCAYLDESMKGKIALMNTEEDDQEDGVCIQVPVELSDFSSFRTNAEALFPYFKTIPDVPGCEMKAPEYKVKGSFSIIEDGENHLIHYSLSENSYYNKDKIIMGNIPYIIDTNQIEDQSLNLSVTMWVPIGTVDIAANRETMEYTRSTIAFINKLYNEIAKEYAQLINKTVKDCLSLREAKQIFYDLGSVRHQERLAAIKWVDATTGKSYYVADNVIQTPRSKEDELNKMPDHFNIYWNSKNYRKRSYDKFTSVNNGHIKDISNIILVDKPCQWKTKISKWVNQEGHTEKSYLIIVPVEGMGFNWQDLVDYWRLDEYSILNVSSLKITPTVSVSGKKTVAASYDHVGDIFLYKDPGKRTSTGKLSVDHWNKASWEDTENTDKKFYVNIYAFQIRTGEGYVNILDASVLDKMIDTYNHYYPNEKIYHIDIYGIKNLDNIKDDDTWVDVIGFIKEKLCLEKHKEMLIESMLYRGLFEKQFRPFFDHIEEVNNKDSIAYKLITKVKEISSQSEEAIKTQIYDVLTHFGYMSSRYDYIDYNHHITEEGLKNEKVKEIMKLTEEAEEKYPLTSAIAWFPGYTSSYNNMLNEHRLTEVMKYINLIEGDQK